MRQSFGEQLRGARKKRGLTVAILAKACGTSRSYITLIENDRRLPGSKVLPKIALALHVKTVVVLNWYLEEIRQKLQRELKIS